MDADSLASLALRRSKIRCPHCGGNHELTNAMLDSDQGNTPRLPNAPPSEIASTRVWRVTGLAMRDHPDADVDEEVAGRI
jgi:hypothetical protein